MLSVSCCGSSAVAGKYRLQGSVFHKKEDSKYTFQIVKKYIPELHTEATVIECIHSANPKESTDYYHCPNDNHLLQSNWKCGGGVSPPPKITLIHSIPRQFSNSPHFELEELQMMICMLHSLSPKLLAISKGIRIFTLFLCRLKTFWGMHFSTFCLSHCGFHLRFCVPFGTFIC